MIFSLRPNKDENSYCFALSSITSQYNYSSFGTIFNFLFFDHSRDNMEIYSNHKIHPLTILPLMIPLNALRRRKLYYEKIQCALKIFKGNNKLTKVATGNNFSTA